MLPSLEEANNGVYTILKSVLLLPILHIIDKAFSLDIKVCTFLLHKLFHADCIMGK